MSKKDAAVGTAEDRIVALARTFPSVRRKMREDDAKRNGLVPWDATRLAAASRPWSTGEKSCVAFLLSVWNRHDFGFDVMQAIAGWDDAHRRAFAAWAAAPFFL